MVPPAPPRLSMTNCAPHISPSFWNTFRPSVGAARLRIGDQHLDRPSLIGGLRRRAAGAERERQRARRSPQQLTPRQRMCVAHLVLPVPASPIEKAHARVEPRMTNYGAEPCSALFPS